MLIRLTYIHMHEEPPSHVTFHRELVRSQVPVTGDEMTVGGLHYVVTGRSWAGDLETVWVYLQPPAVTRVATTFETRAEAFRDEGWTQGPRRNR